MHGAEIRAVLLDLDDTLTDRSATVRAYAQHFIRDFGARLRPTMDLPMAAAELIRIDRDGYNQHRASDLAQHEAWRSSPGASALAAHWDRHFALCTQAREGLLPLVDALMLAGIKLGVVTNGRTDKQRRKLDALGLRDRLGVVLISEEFGVGKPDESIFCAAAAELAVFPRECMFIGDNPEKDVRGAAAVGMRAVWFRATLRWPEGVALPQESVASLREVLGLLGCQPATTT
jgi:putative hydrolase of the HAD superfamily